jgi:SAM-dependent methyltransferase
MSSTGSLSAASIALDALDALRDNRNSPVMLSSTRDALALWPGWGQLAPAFDPVPAGKWVQVADRLDDVLEEAARNAAAKIIDTSFYTPPWLGERLWRLLVSAGFDGGRVLDPGCGHGALMSAAPAGLPIEFTGIEADPTSAAIASALHPGATIHAEKLQKISVRANYFDAAVANVPFGRDFVSDQVHNISGSLHEYFLRRAIDAVRPGGYVVAITSRYTMDSENGVRSLLQHADLVAALRLPTGTFEGTSIVADIVVFQVREQGAQRSGWTDSVNVEEAAAHGYSRSYYSPTRSVDRRDVIAADPGVSSKPLHVNKYWAAHPDHVGGAMVATGNRYNGLAVIADNPRRSACDIVEVASQALPAMTPRSTFTDADAFTDVPLVDAEGRQENSFHLIDDVVVQVCGGTLHAVARPSRELRDLIGLRDVAVTLTHLEADADRPDEDIAAARAEALERYTAYVNRFGAINRGELVEGKIDPETDQPRLTWRRPTLGGFRQDPDYPLVLALEAFDQDTGAASPAPILLRRINRRPPRVERVDTPADALAVTVAESGAIDLARVASLLGLDNPDSAAAALGDLVYRDPQQDGRWCAARDYLSGNVRSKIAAAAAAAVTDAGYRRNVVALKAIKPADLSSEQIRVGLGAPWLHISDIADFIREELGVQYPPQIVRTPLLAMWEFDTARTGSADAQLTYGTKDFSPMQLLLCGLNGKRPIVYDELPNHGRVRNIESTAAAVDKLHTLAERFSVWIWEDAARTARIVDDYNERFSSWVARRPDGSHLSVPGLATDIELWKTQRDFLDHALSIPRALAAHVPGAGKTKIMACLVVLLRKYGLANKPMITVPKNVLEQIAREIHQAFPTGRFLVAGEGDLTGDKRRLFAARCATGDWDAVIVTHEAFSSLSIDPRAEKMWLERQTNELRSHLLTATDYSQGAKQIARAVRSFEERISNLRTGVSDKNQITFEQLGVDYLCVDITDRKETRTRRPACVTFMTSRDCLPTRSGTSVMFGQWTWRAHGTTGGHWRSARPEDRAQRRAALLDDRLARWHGAPGGGSVPTNPRRLRHTTDLRIFAGRPPTLAGTRVPDLRQRDAAGSRAIHGHRRRRGRDAVGRGLAGRQTALRACGTVDYGFLPEGSIPAPSRSRHKHRTG